MRAPLVAAPPAAAGVIPDDAAVSGNPGSTPDAGADPGAGAGGCCDARGAAPPSWLAALIAAAAFGRVRRRGTKARR